ncbi:MAG: PAS domain S-box protein [Roseofilum sp. SID1]|uniref:PAS domain S-box protein n=1 Tax=Roseofilum sp. SID1 TaxID=2821497 RepID=UPI001B0DA7A9|nr:PAS domain S-box protein [Roseofilum sp. SID1]MBP0039665.1 PAS domain S-box protein [Roseofilum sp. SID1]
MLHPLPSSPTRLIIAHPQPESLAWLSTFLLEQGYHIEWATVPSQVIPLLDTVDPSLIFVEVSIPSFLALELCESLHTDPSCKNIPIFALNSSGTSVDRIAFFEAGVKDYLVCPLSLVELRVKVESYIQYNKKDKENLDLRRSLQKKDYIIEQLEASWVLSEEQFHKIFFSSPSLLFLMSYDRGIILEINEHFMAYTGYDRTEVIGEKISNLKSFLFSEDWDSLVQRLEQQQELSNIEIIFKNKDNQQRIGLISVQIIKLGGQKYLLFNINDVTELTHSKQLLQNSENQLLAMFGAMDEAIMVFNYEGDCIKIAPTRSPISLYHQKQKLPQKTEYIIPSQIAEFKKYWTRYVIDRRTTIENLEYCWPIEGQEHWFMSTISPLNKDTAIWVSREITHRKETERKLGLLERAIAASTNGITISDSTKPGNPIIYVNSGFEKLTGYTKAEILGRTCTILQGDDRDQSALTILRKALKEKKACRITLKNHRKDGTVFWNDLSLSPIFNEQQELVYYIGVQTDVTELQLAKDTLNQQYHLLEQEIEERKRIESALRKSETKYRQLVDSANSIILQVDCKGNVVFFNEFAQRFFGYTEAEIIGQNVKGTIVPIQDTEGNILHSTIDHILENTDQYVTYENENQLKNGDRVWIEWTNRILYNESGDITGILSVGMDATARKQTQLALQSAKQAAEIANQTKSQFIARMSHELRTPLNAILGFTQILRRECLANSEHQEYLQIINRSGEHLLDLINDILSLSKIEAGKISLEESYFNLNRLFDEVQDILKLKADQKGILVSTTINPNVPDWVIADQRKLRQILINLLSNSLKFTHQGEVKLRVFPAPQSNQLPIQDYIWEIQDTGEGIDSQELPLLFEPFMQTSSGVKSGQGTGLGLTICKQLLQLMGGDIHISSQVGMGTLVRVRLPLRTVHAEEIPEQRVEKQAIALAPNQPIYRILVVDDHWENRRLLLKQLQLLGFELHEAENGEQALDLWRSWSPDLIWMDLRMPVMDGYQATRLIRMQEQNTGRAAIPILALTASALEEDQILIEEAGCNELVYKPVTQAVLLDKMSHYLSIEYVYETSDDREMIAHPVDRTEALLNGTQLMKMPMDWLNQLHQAATQADEEFIQKLLQEIPEAESDLREAIADLLHHYRLDRILDATLEAIEGLAY